MRDLDGFHESEVFEVFGVRIFGKFGDCPLALRGNPGVFALGASVDPALGRIGGAAVRGRATGARPELVQSAIKFH